MPFDPFSPLKKLYGSIPSFARSGKKSLTYLNITQFLGVINDNVFKFVMAYLLIDTLGYGKASSILSATGAIYVIPFLLFSSSAGILADRFSKQKLLVVMKAAEIILMCLAVVAFAIKSVWGCFALLFILSTHSAIFGPSKYGIIPELVPTDKVSRANGIITSFTYFAIILGTFLASFLTEITDRRFVLIAFFCLLVAIGGFFSALAVKQTAPQGSKKKINLLFLREIYETLKYTRTVRHLLPAIFGSSFFLMVGAFTQLNIIPFALQSLNLSEVAGGYLFLATALGIALGSMLAGKASRKRIELGLSCLAGLGISVVFACIGLSTYSLTQVIIFLVLLGILGGFFVVPFDTFIQVHSDHGKRGQTIGAANFLSFSGVLLASFALYFFNEICGLSSAKSFIVMGVLTFLFSIVMTLRLSDLSIPFFSRKVLHPLYRFKRPDVEAIENATGTLLVMEKATWRDALLLAGTLPNTHFLIPSGSKKWHWAFRFFYSIHQAPEEAQASQLIDACKKYSHKEMVPCLLLDKEIPQKEELSSKSFLDYFKRSHIHLQFVKVVKDPESKKLTIQFE